MMYFKFQSSGTSGPNIARHPKRTKPAYLIMPQRQSYVDILEEDILDPYA